MHVLHWALCSTPRDQEWDLSRSEDAVSLREETCFELLQRANWSDGAVLSDPQEASGILSYRNDPDAFLATMEECRQRQLCAMVELVEDLAGRLALPLPNPEKPDNWPAIGHGLFRHLAERQGWWPGGDHVIFSALKVMKMAFGEYIAESHFFDLIHHHPRVPDTAKLEMLAADRTLYLVPVTFHY